MERSRARDNWPRSVRQACDELGCQSMTDGSSAEGAMRAAGRSLPEMSLAFALMAAINGSKGSRPTLSYGI